MKGPELVLRNKVALITGATGGIGSAIAKAFGASGARVFLNGRSQDRLTSLAEELRSKGVETGCWAGDIAAAGAARQAVEAVVGAMGRIDVLVNAAGINRPQTPEEVTEKNWDDVLNVNLKALFFLCQAAGQAMIGQGGGKIVNISSQAGIIALPLRAAYCSSKAAVNHLTRTLAFEWAKHRINVNAVAPTFVLTPLTEGMLADEAFRKYVLESIPLGRMATPEEIAYSALFLASNLADMITGHVLTVDGGWTIK